MRVRDEVGGWARGVSNAAAEEGVVGRLPANGMRH